MRLLAIVAVSLGLSASAVAVCAQPVSAPPTASPTAPEGVKAAKKKDGVVCHTETPTGSHFPVKVCTTREERRAQNAAANKVQESMQAATPVIPN
jgi:hypothetical protein